MMEFFNTTLSSAVLPSTIVVVLVFLFWMTMLLGAIDLEVLDFDFDIDGELHTDGFFDWGAILLRFLNIGSVPLMIWMTPFAFTFFLVSYFWRPAETDLTLLELIPVWIRSLTIGVLGAKLLTEPLRGEFDIPRQNTPEDALGRLVRVRTSTVTASCGEGMHFPDGYAPLYYQIRSSSQPLERGDWAELAEYLPDQEAYLVRRVDPDQIPEEVQQ